MNKVIFQSCSYSLLSAELSHNNFSQHLLMEKAFGYSDI